MITDNEFPKLKKHKKNYLKPLLYIIILNSFIPFIIWKIVRSKIDEIEFIDTFRFTINLFICSIFYLLQAYLISLFFGNQMALFYITITAFIIFIYTKLAPTNAKEHIEFNTGNKQA